MNHEFKEVIEAMMNPGTYDEKVERVRTVQTYHSYIFLTEKYAYKIKKPVRYPYFDFTTLQKRKETLEKEVELNKRISGGIYLGVLPVNESGGKIKIGGEGKTVEYVLKMVEIPQETIMTKLLEENKVGRDDIEELARIIAEFHSKAKTDKKIEKFGSLEVIRFNWDENFEQTEIFKNITVTEEQFNFIKEKIFKFLQENKGLFEKRVRDKKIRDCHGDLYSDSIFISDRIYIFDAVEFNDRFRFSDVASDIGFLAMDLDVKGRSDLSEYLIQKYVEVAKDFELKKLLNFYKCYRAYIRGKVNSFKLNEKTAEGEKEKAKELARKYFELSYKYASELAEP
jgi:hypothetical protein